MLVIVKECTSCGCHKTLEKFNKSKVKLFGKHDYCRECQSILNKKRYEEKSEEIKKQVAEYREDHYDEVIKTRRKRRNKANAYERNKRKTDPLFALAQNTRRRVRSFLSGKKSKRTIELLGCEITEYKNYLEKKFVKGMNWDNYGEWHIDHIIPLASAENQEQLEKLFHYTNTQPLWGKDNCSKGARL